MNFQSQIKEQVKQIRSMSEQFLTDICSIRHKIGEEIIQGESIPLYDPGVEKPCRFINRSGSENVNLASQERATQQSIFTGLYRLQLPFGTAISQGDLVDFTDIALNKVRTFNVVFVPPFHNMTGAFIIFLQEET